MSVPMKPSDPAYWMLFDGHTTTPVPGLYRESCYICRDPEFAQMGLPLCYPCLACKGHVPADDTVCTDCGHEVGPDDYPKENPPQDNVVDMGWKAGMVGELRVRSSTDSGTNTMPDSRSRDNHGPVHETGT